MRQLAQKLGLRDGSTFVVLAGRFSLVASSAVWVCATLLTLWAAAALLWALARQDWGDARWAGRWLALALAALAIASFALVTSLDALDMVLD